MATAYAVLGDLTGFGVLSTAAFGSLSATQLQNAVDAANATADSYLGARYKLPLTAWGADLKQKVVAIARFELLVSRGFAPEGDSGAAIVESKKDALKWLEGVAEGIISPLVTDSGNGGAAFVEQGVADPQNAGQFVINRPSTNRGW